MDGRGNVHVRPEGMPDDEWAEYCKTHGLASIDTTSKAHAIASMPTAVGRNRHERRANEAMQRKQAAKLVRTAKRIEARAKAKACE